MDMNVEIFATGKWNGMNFTLADLNTIAATFKTLGGNHKVPLKFGHNDKQKMTDGQPALGWVSDVKVVGNKLMAKFTDVPDIVHAAFEKKLYRNVSIELDFDVSYKGQHYPMVLSGVALLGADLPAVNTLKELTHYLGQDAGFSVGRHAMFSAIAGNIGDEQMDIKEISDKLDAVIASNATLASENTTLKAQVATFTASADAAVALGKKTAVDAKRTEVKAVFEDAVKAGAITPAAREQFSKLLRVDDDVAVMAIDITEVKALVNTGKKGFSTEQGRQGERQEDGNLAPDVKMANAIQEVLAKKEAADWGTAQAIVFARDPKLAREYVNFNEKE